MDKFRIQDLIIGLGTDQADLNQIFLCNKSQLIVCLDEAPDDALESLKGQLRRILSLLDRREHELGRTRGSRP